MVITCSSCSRQLAPNEAVCTQCGRPNNVMSFGGTIFRWPLPRTMVDVGGRQLPAELLACVASYALSTILLLTDAVGIFRDVPTILTGLFSSDPYGYFVSFALTLAVGVLLLLLLAMGAATWLLYQGQQLGRNLSAATTAILCGLLIAGGIGAGGMSALVLTLSAISTALLYLSPWCRHALTAPTRRPAAVEFSLQAAILVLAMFGVLGLLLLPGLRFLDYFGASIVLAVLAVIVGVVLGWLGWLRLDKRPDPLGRILLSGGMLVLFIALVLMTTGVGQIFVLSVLLTVVLPLWLPATARRWFGEAPIQVE